MANFVRNVLIDGVKYAVGDKRIEGDNFAYIQVPEAVTIGTNLTDLTPIQKALDSTDGSLLYVPSLNALFSPTASSDPTIRIWSSTVGDKGYQLKATLNASGVLQSAVVNEAAAEAGLVISYADFAQLREEALDDDNWDPTHTYLITDKAKEVASKLVNVDDVSGTLNAVGQFQLESGMNPFMGLIFPLNYFYSAFEVEDDGAIVCFTSSGEIMDFGGSFPTRTKYDICPVFSFDDGMVGIILREKSQSESSAPNIFTDDYQTIKRSTSELESSEPYVDSPIAKGIGQILINHFYSYVDDSHFNWDSDHFTVSQKETTINRAADTAVSFYTLSNIGLNTAGTQYLKFTTTAEWYNGDITVFIDDDHKTCLGMRIDPKPEEFVRISKRYMEIEVNTPETTMKANVTGDTLNLFSVQPAAASKIIHYPESVLFTSDSAFELKLAPYIDEGSDPYTPDAKIEISKDGLNWIQPVWDETNGISLVADTTNDELGKYSVFIRSDNYINKDDSSVFGFSKFSEVSGSNIEVSGILDSLWGGKTPQGNDSKYMFKGMVNLTTAKDLVFPTTVEFGIGCKMFQNCTALTKTPILPATTMAVSCYQAMFSGCTSLTQAPVLPATTLASQCYAYMFSGCTALTQAPVLPATTLDQKCYMEMFSGCTSLTQAPTLPATTLAKQCYDIMFSGCTSLTHAPALPATTLAQYCYRQMFQGCTALTQAPELPATDFVNGSKGFCYHEMFKGCISLTKPVFFPVLDFPTSATTGGSMFISMFEGCTGIKWAASGTPYIIKTTDGAVAPDNPHFDNMFKGNGGGTAIPEGTGTPVINTTYYLEA